MDLGVAAGRGLPPHPSERGIGVVSSRHAASIARLYGVKLLPAQGSTLRRNRISSGRPLRSNAVTPGKRPIANRSLERMSAYV